jgi:hypothetical protein
MDSDFLELVLLAKGITVSLRSNFELARTKNSLLCSGSHPNFSGNPPTLIDTVSHLNRLNLVFLGKNKNMKK